MLFLFFLTPTSSYKISTLQGKNLLPRGANSLFLKFSILNIIFGPSNAKTCLRAYADSEGPDQPVHPLTESLYTIEYLLGEQMPG